MILLWVFMGCSAQPGDSDTGFSQAQLEACFDDDHRDGAVCTGDPACVADDGRRCDGSGNVFVGCLPANTDCNDIEVYCEPDDGSGGCVALSQSCPYETGSCPPGWTGCTDDTDAPFCE